MRFQKRTMQRWGLLAALLIGGCDQELSEPVSTQPVTQIHQIPEFKATFLHAGGKSNPDSRKTANERMSYLDDVLTSYQAYSLNVSELSSFVSSNEVAAFKLTFSDTLQWDIVLEPSNIIAPNYKSTVLTSAGEESGEVIQSIFYRGHTTTGNNVNLMLEDGIISGFIEETDSDIYIENAAENGADPIQNEIIIYNTKDYVDKEEMICAVEDIEEAVSSEIDKQARTAEASCDGKLIVEIATFANYDRYKNVFNKSVGKTNKRILQIINSVENNYDDFGIELQVVEQQVATCSSCMPFDDSDGIRSNGKTLDNFKDWAIRDGFKSRHDVGIMFMGRNSSQDTKGRAYQDQICLSSYPTPYAIVKHESGLFFEYKKRVRHIVAHEMGHVFGAKHNSCQCIMKASAPIIPRNKWSTDNKRIINASKNRGCLCEAITNGWILYSKGEGEGKRINTSASTAGQLKVGDFNGDGADDILRLLNHDKLGLGWYIKYRGEGPWVQAAAETTSLEESRIGDFDGDGKDDVLVIKGSSAPEGEGLYVSYNANTPFRKIVGWGTENPPSSIHYIRVGDFNGDKVSDIMRSTKLSYPSTDLSFWHFCAGKKGRNQNNLEWNTYRLMPASSLSSSLIGDFDGDGKDDVFTKMSDNPHWQVAYAASDFRSWNELKESVYTSNRLKIGDYNGDGKADLLTFRGASSSTGRGWAVVYGGQGAWTHINPVSGLDEGIGKLIVGDFNGDGASDVLYINN